jgi:hypothetical protein
MLHQHILACHPHIGTTVFNVGGHIGRPNDHQLDMRMIGIENQLATAEYVLSRYDIGRCQQRQGLFQDAPL